MLLSTLTSWFCYVFVKITWAAEVAMAKDNAENIMTVKTIV